MIRSAASFLSAINTDNCIINIICFFTDQKFNKICNFFWFSIAFHQNFFTFLFQKFFIIPIQFTLCSNSQGDLIIPVVITVYADRSFSFITKTPPAAVLLKKACNIKSGSGVPNKTKVATIKRAEVQKIAELKMPDLNAASIEAATSMIEGTAKSMGIVVED